MELPKFLAAFALLCIAMPEAKGYSLKEIEDNNVSETAYTDQNTSDNQNTKEIIHKNIPEKFLETLSNDNTLHSRQKRLVLSATAFGINALRRQQLRWTNKLQRDQLRNERYKLRNELRIKTMTETNQKIQSQLAQWNMNQQKNRLRQQQRWAQINNQLNYPMNFQQFMEAQQKMQQSIPLVNFQQHPLPIKQFGPVSPPAPTLPPVG